MGDGSKGCDKLRKLMEEYSARTELYSASVNVLLAKMGTAPKGVYEALREENLRASVLCEDARKAVEKHRKEHDCS